MTVRGGDLDMLPKYRLRRRAIASTLRRADRIFSVSVHLAERAVALGAPRPSIPSCPTASIRPSSPTPTAPPPDEPWDCRSEQRLVVCAGNLLAEKGQHLLVECSPGSRKEPMRRISP